MPFYEYISKKQIDNQGNVINVNMGSCDLCFNVFEIMQSIMSEPLKLCPKCGSPIIKLISQISGVIWKGRQANEYNDIKAAKYWRDKDGNRWKVTESDGRSNCPTVPSKRKRSDEEAKKIVERRKIADKNKRNQESYSRFVRKMKNK